MQANEQMLQSRYETTEMERVKAVGAEHQGSYPAIYLTPILPSKLFPALRQLAEIEMASKKAGEDHKKSLKSAERRIKELESQIERNRRMSDETGFLQKRVAEELEEVSERHRKDLAERDLRTDQAKTRYQGTTIS